MATTPKKSLWPATHGELVAAGYSFTSCKPCSGPTCSTQIFWYRTPNGKAMPLAEIGSDAEQLKFQPHFADCSDRKRF